MTGLVWEQQEFPRHIKTVAALDVGQARDYSVLSIVETWEIWRTEAFSEEHPVGWFYVLVFQQRFNGTYPDQVDEICEKLKNYTNLQKSGPVKPEISQTLIVETNGIGLSMFQALKKQMPAGWRVQGALLTAGDAIAFTNGVWHLNKREIINTLTDLLDRSLLKIPEDLATRELLLNEAAGFMRTFTATGKEQLNSDTESRHDDLIISLAYAVWYSVTKGECKVLPAIGFAPIKTDTPLTVAFRDAFNKIF